MLSANRTRMLKDETAGDAEAPESGHPPLAGPAPVTVKVPKWPLLLLGISLLLHGVTLVVLLLLLSRSSAAPPTSSAAPDGSSEGQCSPHGLSQLDDPTACDCHQCWIGPRCESQVSGCVLDATDGNPLLFEGFWRNVSLQLPIPATYRMGYMAGGTDFENRQLAGLEAAIRDLHIMVGNVAPEVARGHFLVLGVGSTQLISAAIWALVQLRRPRVFTSQTPYYPPYRNVVEYHNSSLMRWSDQPGSGDDIVEFITSPNNPDGALRTPVHSGAEHVYDCAYWWPHFTAITQPLAHNIMLFTLSKLTGHAGTRVGWALVKDADIAKGMAEYIGLTTLGSPHESQLHAWQLVRYMLDHNGQPLHYAIAEMQRRWERIQVIQAAQAQLPVFTLPPPAPPKYCRFQQRTVPSSPPYAWLRCAASTLQADEDCLHRLRNASGVEGRKGIWYGGTRFEVRLSLLMRPGEFDLLADRLQGWATGSPLF